MPPSVMAPRDALTLAEYHELEERLGRAVFVGRLERELRLRTHPLEPFFGNSPVEFADLVRFGLKCAGLHGRGRRNALQVVVERNDVTLSGWPRGLDGFRLLQLSDLHFENNLQATDRIIALLAGLDYDLCVLTRDYRARTWGPFELAMHELARLRAAVRGEVYAVLGNHDSIAMLPYLRRMDLPVLFNEGVRIARGGASFHLAGIDDPHYHRVWDLPRSLRGRTPGTPAVLLSHSSRPYREAEAAGVSLLLCGHSHGGQLCLPGGIPVINNERSPRRMIRGPWRHRALQGYTSRGAGVTGVDARFNCPPEITLHVLHCPHE
ncbi:MAG: metallophosphoesterase [Kiritimatiellia bacterium]